MVYLIDTIGTEAGMPKYDEMFYNEFQSKGIDVQVLSNYESNFSRHFICNFYHSGKVGNILLLLMSYLKVLFFFLGHTKDIYVYQSFGLRYIDILFISIFRYSRKTFVLVHDVFEITSTTKKFEGRKFKIQRWFYNHCINNVICHSQIAVDVLKNKTSFSGNIILFPHFPYRFDKSYNEANIPAELKNAVVPGKVNFLMFGQLRKTKGVDYIVGAMKYLQDNEAVNVVIAGSDKAKLLQGWSAPDNVKLVLRYITEEEENFLFCNCDVVLIPYKEVYQSGVMETIVNFRKPAILSDIRAFRDFHRNYPSFSKIFKPATCEALAQTMIEYINSVKQYSQDELDKYYSNHDIQQLIDAMNSILKDD